ncbi:hypothetical protein C8R47DRAFT_1083896 [Mycena vitilis]|nr:hypothetical protein C8R47DRAFT_1083896 [Mycena vitilis]
MYIGSVRLDVPLEVVEGGVEPLESWWELTEIFDDFYSKFDALTLVSDSETEIDSDTDPDMPSMEATDNNENDVASCKGSDYTSSEVSDVRLPTDLGDARVLDAENQSAPLEAKCLLTDSGRYLPSLASPPVLSSSPSVRQKYLKNDARPFGPEMNPTSPVDGRESRRLVRVSQLAPAHDGELNAKMESEMEAGDKPHSDHSFPDPLLFDTLIPAEPNSVVQFARERGADSFYEDEKMTDRFSGGLTHIPGVLLKLSSRVDYSLMPDCVQHTHAELVEESNLLRSSRIDDLEGGCNS